MILTSYFPMAGGWNLESPPLATAPGELLDVNNYECLVGGGYRRIKGYVAYDGSATPAALPGSGKVLGVHIYKGDLYAIRDVAGAGRLYRATAAGWVEVNSTITWAPGAKYCFANYNFFGQDEQSEMFIANGQNVLRKFDGTNLVDVPIGPGLFPKLVVGYAKFLFVAVESSLMHSQIGDPTAWDAQLGAGEIAVGDTITELRSGPSSLVVGCEDSTKVLYGSTSMDGTSDAFRLEELNQVGPFQGTMANIGGQLIALERSGVMSLQAAQTFGNFQYASLSMKIKSAMRLFDQNSVATINRESGQYRVFNGGAGLYFTFAGQQMIGITRVSFANRVECITSGFDNALNEVTFFGSDDGFVYQMDTGYRFNAKPISAYLVTSFHHFGGPTQQKRFRKVQPDMRVEGTETAQLGISVTTDYSKGYISRGNTGALVATGGSLWDFSSWDFFVWDSYYHHDASVRVSTVGTNMAVLISSDGSENALHSVYGIATHYSPRRMKR